MPRVSPAVGFFIARRFPVAFGAIALATVGYKLYRKYSQASAARTPEKSSSSVSNGGPSINPDPREIPVGEKFGGNTRDVVDQASWESFPASDPPAY